MSFDDRLRDELRRATESHPLDAEHTLRGMHSERIAASTTPATEPVAVALVDDGIPRRRHVRAQRLAGVAAALVVLAGGIAIPVALRDRPHDTAQPKAHHDPKHPAKKHSNVVPGPVNSRVALQAIASALNTTTDSGSYNVAYTLTDQPAAQNPPVTSCVAVEKAGAPQNDLNPPLNCSVNYSTAVTTTGHATVNLNPFAMIAVSNVSNFGPVTVRVDDTNYWETAGSASPPQATDPGSALSSFASLVESTLGQREGAEAMMGLASPNGYLAITRDQITGAAKTGTGTFNGVPVTTYHLTEDPFRLASYPGLSPEESTTVDAALAVLRNEGYAGNTTDVSVDANGFIVHTVSVNHFADGGTISSEDTFSNFGCAGTVDLPGRPAVTSTSTCTDVATPASTTTTAAATTTTIVIMPGVGSLPGLGPSGSTGPSGATPPGAGG